MLVLPASFTKALERGVEGAGHLQCRGQVTRFHDLEVQYLSATELFSRVESHAPFPDDVTRALEKKASYSK